MVFDPMITYLETERALGLENFKRNVGKKHLPCHSLWPTQAVYTSMATLKITLI